MLLVIGQYFGYKLKLCAKHCIKKEHKTDRIQNLHLGTYIVAFMVRNYVLQLRLHITLKGQFRPYISPQIKILNTDFP